jgi:hypothetical protein
VHIPSKSPRISRLRVNQQLAAESATFDPPVTSMTYAADLEDLATFCCSCVGYVLAWLCGQSLLSVVTMTLYCSLTFLGQSYMHRMDECCACNNTHVLKHLRSEQDIFVSPSNKIVGLERSDCVHLGLYRFSMASMGSWMLTIAPLSARSPRVREKRDVHVRLHS